MGTRLYKLNAFPKEKGGGNPAGVVLEADLMSEENMQEIATNVGFSETAFVLKSKEADFKIRFFTPLKEVDLCGHATIATFNLLRDLDIIDQGEYTQETKAGILNIEVKKDSVYMQQNKPIIEEFVLQSEIEDCFNNFNFVDESMPIRIVSTGVSEIFVPIKSTTELNSLFPDFESIKKLSQRYRVIGIHCFALTDERGVQAYGRNFAPAVGIDEESATGTSNGALACYLNNFVHKSKLNFTLRQGYSMDKPSEIKVILTKENKEIKSVYVGGTAKLI